MELNLTDAQIKEYVGALCLRILALEAEVARLKHLALPSVAETRP